jgi:hypothetical protein
MSDQVEIGGARRRRVAAEDAAREAAVTADPVEGAAPGRRKRVRKPFGSQEQKLSYPNRDGYHRHWFNDVPGRLMRANEAGYEQVKDRDGKPVCMVVGVGRGGGALTAYLHEIPLEDYQEDMAAADSVVHERLGQIQSGKFNAPAGRDGELRYAGSNLKGDIKIETGSRR